MMNASSRAAQATLTERLSVVARRFSTADGLIGLGNELYSVADVMVGQPRLRRTAADPATPPAGRSALIERIFGGQLSGSALELVRAAVAERWSSPWDLTDSLERLGDDSLLLAAEQAQQLDEVEDELFRFERTLDAESELSGILDEQSVPAERRVELVRRLIGTKALPVTTGLVAHAVSSSRKRSVVLAMDDLIELAAQRQSRSVARVQTAVPLSAEQESRLTEVLGGIYHRPISVRTVVAPGVIGGLVIRVGDEIIDGSVASRFAAVRKALGD
jgi:F-type H+-transporting ATPase subunit delta